MNRRGARRDSAHAGGSNDEPVDAVVDVEVAVTASTTASRRISRRESADAGGSYNKENGRGAARPVLHVHAFAGWPEAIAAHEPPKRSRWQQVRHPGAAAAGVQHTGLALRRCCCRARCTPPRCTPSDRPARSPLATPPATPVAPLHARVAAARRAGASVHRHSGPGGAAARRTQPARRGGAQRLRGGL